MPPIRAILLDAGGVFLFPSPDLMLPPIRAAGVSPSLTDLHRAHYQAIAACDTPTRQPPGPRWWYEYLYDYVAACGVPPGDVGPVAEEIELSTRGFSWTHVGPGAVEGLRSLAGFGIPIGIVSNSSGEVAEMLRRLDICYAVDGVQFRCRGVKVGIVIDSAIVGVAKPDPKIFDLALEKLRLSGISRDTVVHVGDSLRYDVTGAAAAGIRPIHLDPYGHCPEPAGHEHIHAVGDLTALLDGG